MHKTFLSTYSSKNLPQADTHKVVSMTDRPSGRVTYKQWLKILDYIHSFFSQAMH